ncbi:DUF3224 domain-containing protein [Microbacterium alcoholitolerans]|uniref:DUF3224 domain-containing protein n=1 Tax=unclassified Microbacterium TaxID=2609290 RepID=UPI003D172B15
MTTTMHASGTFTVAAFAPVDPPLDTGVETAVSVAVVRMEKHFTGEVAGRSTTVFTYALDHGTEIGGYVAMESFDGVLGGRSGTFNFSHSATTVGEDRSDESFTIIPSSGAGELAGISGSGGIAVDADGTHRIWFDYRLPE